MASVSGPGTCLEGELALQRARDAGGEQALLVRLGQRAERGEGFAVVFQGEPVEGEVRAVGQHRLAGACVGEGVVVGAERRPVRGLAHRDVERVVVVAGGEHRAPHLEQHEVERGPEILRQMGLDQGRADGTEIVAEADAHTRLLARLGFRVGMRGRHGRTGERGSLDAGGPVAGAGGGVLAGAALRRVRGVVGLGSGDVLGPDQALDELHPALIADGDDAPGDGDVLGPEDGAGLDRSLDLGEAGLVRLGFVGKRLGPLVFVHVDELVVADVQALALGLLLVGGLARGGMHAPEAGEVGPVHLDPSVGPLPAGCEFVRRGLQPVHGDLAQKVGILEPDAPLVLVGEEIAVDGTAGRLVGVYADEGGDGGSGRHAVLGEHALHLPAGRPVALIAHLHARSVTFGTKPLRSISAA